MRKNLSISIQNIHFSVSNLKNFLITVFALHINLSAVMNLSDIYIQIYKMFLIPFKFLVSLCHSLYSCNIFLYMMKGVRVRYIFFLVFRPLYFCGWYSNLNPLIKWIMFHCDTQLVWWKAWGFNTYLILHVSQVFERTVIFACNIFL
jgi:hypothetical protein